MNKYELEVQAVEQKIFIVRGCKVMLDNHLAILYRVATKVLLQSIQRNIKRFPIDFMFQLTSQEENFLRSQIVTSKQGQGRGGRRYRTYAFTENGVAMLSSVLKSERAIQVNLQIMRAFTNLREWSLTQENLQRKIKKLERKFDKKFGVVFQAIKLLLDGPEKPIHIKGFRNKSI